MGNHALVEAIRGLQRLMRQRVTLPKRWARLQRLNRMTEAERFAAECHLHEAELSLVSYINRLRTALH